MPILRTRVPTARIAELRLPRLQVELPAARVVSVTARAGVILHPLKSVKTEKGEDHEPTT